MEADLADNPYNDLRPKRLVPQSLPAQGQLQRAGVDAPGSLAEMPGHMQYQRLIAARAAQARRVREDQIIDEQRRLAGSGVPAAERKAVKERRKAQIDLAGAQLTGQMFYPDVTGRGRGYSTSGTSMVGGKGSFPSTAAGERFEIHRVPKTN